MTRLDVACCVRLMRINVNLRRMERLLEDRSVVRWAGSKRRLLPKLERYWPGGDVRYIEPFAGSAALFFMLKPSRAILSDVNSELINAWRQVRSVPIKLHSSLSRLRPSRKRYNVFRKESPSHLGHFERAVRFIYLNRFCFNGLYRTNADGLFNVPYAPSRSGAMPDVDVFRRQAALLKGAKLKCRDFERLVVDEVERDDFVYLDPPFAVANRRLFRQYGANTFGLSDVQRLSKVLRTIDRKGATFVLSYADSREARGLIGDWCSKRVFVQRNVAGFADRRRRSVELIISNMNPR